MENQVKTIKCTESVMKRCSYGKCGSGCQYYCDYISIEGHSRGCLPTECTKYTTKKLNRKQKFND